MAARTKVDYPKIYDYLRAYKRNTITPSQLAYGIGAERIYGATMTKLVRDGYLDICPEKGFYKVII